MQNVVALNVQDYEEDIRLDKFLAENECLQSSKNILSRSYIQKLIKDGLVLVNDKKVKSGYLIKEEDLIKVIIPEPVEIDIMPQNIPIDIIYEDDDIIVVNKPKGMVVHPAPGHYTDTLVNALMYHCKDNLSGINGILRPGIVHRIDMNTTGVVVACKNDKAHIALSEQLKEHSINRVYHAIVNNRFKDKEGTVDKPIGRHPVDRKKMAIVKNGRTAITHYKVIGELKGNYSYIMCKLETGRTHQIRVHMASINHSLYGDDVYGTVDKRKNKCEGQALHAKVLGFIHPTTNQYIEFESDLPEYFKNLLNIL